MASNSITGTVNNDTLFDTVVDDEIFALDGNDEIETSSDSDIIHGDAGTDTLSVNYSSYINDLNINVSSYDIFSGDGLIYVDGADNSNNYLSYPINFYSIEQLKLMGGDGNDSLGSYSYNNIVLDETINGGAGDDFISPGKGFDVVNGGTGYDILELDFNDSPNSVTSNLSNGSSGEYITNDRVVEFSNIEAVGINGSIYDDSFVVPAVKNNSTFSPYIPFIYGGDGFDEIVVDLSDSNEDLSITDSTGLAIYPDYINELSTDSIESYNITSGRGDDSIRLEEYSGLYRDDVINAGAGNDTIATANGYDVVDGGSGYDVLELGLNYSYSSSRITSHLENSNSGEYTSDEGTVEFTNIEEIRVYGSYEDDVLAVPISLQNSPTATNSYIDGGDGLDEIVIDLSDRNEDLSIDNVAGGLNINSPNHNTYLDIYNIEAFDITTGRGDDDIFLNDGYSDDTVNTGAGDDVISTGNGYDVVDGGSGYDVLELSPDFSYSSSRITSHLEDSNSGEYTSDEGTVEFTNIEEIRVLGSNEDDVFAVPVSLQSSPTATNSYIDGGDGLDEIVVNLSDRNEDLSIDNVAGGLNINSPNHNTYLDIYNIEGFNLTTGRGDDDIFLHDGYSDDTVNTGAGNDVINTGSGYDVVDGGSGYDLLNLDFAASFSGVSSHLTDGNSGEYISYDTPTDENVVEFSNIEAVNITGSSYNDVLAAPIGKGDSSTLPLSPSVDGGEGFDELVVNLSDRNEDLSIDNFAGLNISSPNHNNYLDIYSIEAFNITTGRGDDDIFLNDGYSDDTVNTGAGNDVINTGSGYDVVDGGSGYDLLHLDFASSTDGVTSSLSDGNSGEYVNISPVDNNVVEFSNIEAVNITGSSYNDVLAAPIGKGDGSSLPLSPYVDGGEGFDELVIDLSDRNDDLSIDNFAGLNISSPNNNNYLDIYSIEGFNLTTGRGDDDINLDNGYSDDTVNTGAGNDIIDTGNGHDVVDGGSGYDLLNLDFSTALSGVTSSLSDSDSGEYISDEGAIGSNVVEFSNIEAVNVVGSSYNDVLAMPISNSNGVELPFAPSVDGGEGFDEVVVDLSDRNDDIFIDNFATGLNINYASYFDNFDIYSVEAFDITTGRGDDDIFLDQSAFSNETIDTGAGDDYITAGKGDDVVDGGRGYDLLSLDFSTALSGVTSSLSDSNSGEYFTDDSSVEFSNIEEISVWGSAYDDVLVVPLGTSSTNREFPSSPTINGGEGFDELVVDYSEVRSDLDVYSSGGGNIGISISETGNLRDIQHFDLEEINLTTGEGNDNINLDASSTTSHTLHTGAGDDWISFGIDVPQGNNVIDGGSGFDIVNLDYSNAVKVTASYTNDGSILLATDGSKVELSNIEAINITGSSEDDVLIALSGDSSIYGASGFVSGGLGSDTIHGSDNNDNLSGDDGNDSLLGNDGDDYLYGEYGSDILRGGNGDDYLDGGDENGDLLFGDAGNDTINGGLNGDDTIYGGDGDDSISVDNGLNIIFGDAGNDTINGGFDADNIFGGNDNDILSGYSGADTLRGDDGNDSLNGGSDNDLLLGGAGNDTIEGNSGDDFIRGGDNDDLIIGGDGKDTLYGDNGIDTFVLESSVSQSDVIRDFTDNVDLIGLADGLAFGDLTISSNSAETASVIRDTTNSNQVLAYVLNVEPLELTSVDFISI